MYFDDDGLGESGADIKGGEKLPLIVTTRGKWLIFVPSLLPALSQVCRRLYRPGVLLRYWLFYRHAARASSMLDRRLPGCSHDHHRCLLVQPLPGGSAWRVPYRPFRAALSHPVHSLTLRQPAPLKRPAPPAPALPPVAAQPPCDTARSNGERRQVPAPVGPRELQACPAASATWRLTPRG